MPSHQAITALQEGGRQMEITGVKQKESRKWSARRVENAETGSWGRGDSNPHALEHMNL